MEVKVVLDTNDIWIAAQARQCGGELAARDGHFAELPMLRMAVEIPLAE